MSDAMPGPWEMRREYTDEGRRVCVISRVVQVRGTHRSYMEYAISEEGVEMPHWILACLTACADMSDPVAEVADLRLRASMASATATASAGEGVA